VVDRFAVRPRESAGVLFVAPGRQVLLLMRADEVRNPGLWNLPGGRVDAGETPVDAALREAREEAGADLVAWGGRIVGRMRRCRVKKSGRESCYTTVVVTVPRVHVPVLQWESSGWVWVTPEEGLRSNRLHRGLAEILRAV
jgi:8-oxo-dGTP pyrophosphatase MutT (NUDIX family)